MWQIVVVLLLFSFTNGCVPQDRTARGKVMTEEQALYLVQSWATHAHEGMESLTVERNGTFYGQLGGPYLEYSHDQQNLVVRGLIYDEGETVLKIPNLYVRLKKAETEETKTLAGGVFEVDLGSRVHGKKPALNLRRDFRDGATGTKEFIKAVDDLLAAATWWRKQRFYDYLVTTP
jgi:hypothetical protein